MQKPCYHGLGEGAHKKKLFPTSSFISEASYCRVWPGLVQFSSNQTCLALPYITFAMMVQLLAGVWVLKKKEGDSNFKDKNRFEGVTLFSDISSQPVTNPSSKKPHFSVVEYCVCFWTPSLIRVIANAGKDAENSNK